VSTRTVVHLGVLVAISIILTRMFSVMVPIAGVMGIRLSFGEIPLMLAGIMFGPLAGAAAGVVADLTGVGIFGGPYFPGFTLSFALVGFIPGLLLYKKVRDLTFWQLVIAVLVTDIIVSLILNTLWLSIMFDKAVTVLLPPRLLARAILIPAYSMLLWIIVRRYRVLEASTTPNREASHAGSGDTG